jgi:AraC family transcriptional regulator
LYEPGRVRTNDAPTLHLRPSAGSRVRSREVSGFVIAEAHYRAKAKVPLHTHDLAGLAIVVDGGYAKRMLPTAYECRPGTLTVEPPGVSHAESYGRQDVHALLIEVLPWRFDAIADYASVLGAPLCIQNGMAVALARRAAVELRAPDSASALMLEGVALELIAIADRSPARRVTSPPWLPEVVERLRDEFRSEIGLTTLAAGAGVHPAHLARAFRVREGCSVGEFVRRCRVEWAAVQLKTTEASLAQVAQAAGFYDQSHFTRVFTRHIGVSPARYRALVRPTLRSS